MLLVELTAFFYSFCLKKVAQESKTNIASKSFTPDITPLVLAAHKDNYEIIKILLDRGEQITEPVISNFFPNELWFVLNVKRLFSFCLPSTTWDVVAKNA